METNKQPETLQSAVESLSLEYVAEFVPFSKSRNAKKVTKPGDYSLNWKVTVSNGSRSITTDYMEGIGHIPGYKQSWSGRLTVKEFDAIKRTCETGKTGPFNITPIPAPKLRDVMYSLAMDAGAIDHATFEDWASDFGYEPDSRLAEKIYRQCLETALKLRAMIGEDGLAKLRDASQDY